MKEYEITLEDGSVEYVEQENIYEALELAVKALKIHPTKIKSIIEMYPN
jgi:hypothetical protein